LSEKVLSYGEGIILIGSEFCRDCQGVKALFAEHNIDYDYLDISSGIEELKFFLDIRDSSPAFSKLRGSGTIGVPCLYMNKNAYVITDTDHAAEIIKELGLSRAV
jgi:glutaredoxin-related protein